MKVCVFPDAHSAAKGAAVCITDLIRGGSIRVLGLATGRSPIEVYRYITEQVTAKKLNLSELESFNLDEYIGLRAQDPSSFHSYMQNRLFSYAKLRKTHFLRGDVRNLLSECHRYEREIARAGGIDLQLLGIGRNGHIGFNEPGSAHDSRTRPVMLSTETRTANQPDFPVGQAVPKQALTMGIGTILEARKIVLLATGVAKSLALRDALHGPTSRDCPASALQRHRDLTVFVDREAASLLDTK